MSPRDSELITPITSSQQEPTPSTASQIKPITSATQIRPITSATQIAPVVIPPDRPLDMRARRMQAIIARNQADTQAETEDLQLSDPELRRYLGEVMATKGAHLAVALPVIEWLSKKIGGAATGVVMAYDQVNDFINMDFDTQRMLRTLNDPQLLVQANRDHNSRSSGTLGGAFNAAGRGGYRPGLPQETVSQTKERIEAELNEQIQRGISQERRTEQLRDRGVIGRAESLLDIQAPTSRAQAAGNIFKSAVIFGTRAGFFTTVASSIHDAYDAATDGDATSKERADAVANAVEQAAMVAAGRTSGVTEAHAKGKRARRINAIRTIREANEAKMRDVESINNVVEENVTRVRTETVQQRNDRISRETQERLNRMYPQEPVAEEASVTEAPVPVDTRRLSFLEVANKHAGIINARVRGAMIALKHKIEAPLDVIIVPGIGDEQRIQMNLGDRAVSNVKRLTTLIFPKGTSAADLELARQTGMIPGMRVTHEGIDYMVHEVNPETATLIPLKPGVTTTVPTADVRYPSTSSVERVRVFYKGKEYPVIKAGKDYMVLNTADGIVRVKTSRTTRIPGTQEIVLDTPDNILARYEALKKEYSENPGNFGRRRLGLDPEAQTNPENTHDSVETPELLSRLVESLAKIDPETENSHATKTVIGTMYRELLNRYPVDFDLVGVINSFLGQATSRRLNEFYRGVTISMLENALIYVRGNANANPPPPSTVEVALAAELGLTDANKLATYLDFLRARQRREVFHTEEERAAIKDHNDRFLMEPHNIPLDLLASSNGLRLGMDADGTINIRNAEGDVIGRSLTMEGAREIVNSVLQESRVTPGDIAESPVAPPEASELNHPQTVNNTTSSDQAGNIYDGSRLPGMNPAQFFRNFIEKMRGTARNPYATIAESRFEYVYSKTGVDLPRIYRATQDVIKTAASAAEQYIRKIGIDKADGLLKKSTQERRDLVGKAIWFQSASELASRMSPRAKQLSDAITAMGVNVDLPVVFKVLRRYSLIHEMAERGKWSKKELRVMKDAVLRESGIFRPNSNPAHPPTQSDLANLRALSIMVSAIQLSKSPPSNEDIALIARHVSAVQNNTPSHADFMNIHNFSPRERQAVSVLQSAMAQIAGRVGASNYHEILDKDVHVRSQLDPMPGEIREMFNLRVKARQPDPNAMSLKVPTKAHLWWNEYVETGEMSPYETDPIISIVKYARAAEIHESQTPQLRVLENKAWNEIDKINNTSVREEVRQDSDAYFEGLRGIPDLTTSAIDAMISMRLSAAAKAGKITEATRTTITRDILRFVGHTQTLATQAARPGQGARDLTNASGFMFAHFGPDLMFEVLGESFGDIDYMHGRIGPKHLAKLKRNRDAGVIGISYDPQTLEAPNFDAREFASNPVEYIKKGYNAINRFSMALTAQQPLYETLSTGVYNVFRKRALDSIMRVKLGKSSADIYDKTLFLDNISPSVAKEFLELASSDETSDKAADMIAKYMIRKVLPPYGYGNAPKGWERVPGQIATKMGFYSAFTKDAYMDMVSYGSYKTRAAKIGRAALWDGSFLLASKLSGYNLDSWMMLPGMRFLGSPIVTNLIQMRGRPGGSGDNWIRFGLQLLPYSRAAKEIFGAQTDYGTVDGWMRALFSIKKGGGMVNDN